MGVTLEPITKIIRGGPGHEKFGDPYAWSATLCIDGDSVHIKGLSGRFTLADAREVQRVLKDAGYLLGSWERIKNGKVCYFEREIK